MEKVPNLIFNKAGKEENKWKKMEDKSDAYNFPYIAFYF